MAVFAMLMGPVSPGTVTREHSGWFPCLFSCGWTLPLSAITGLFALLKRRGFHPSDFLLYVKLCSWRTFTVPSLEALPR